MAVTYSSYLKIDELLSLQQPLSDGPEHDEMLFIVIHQVYELWFKQILHEIDYLKGKLTTDEPAPALGTMKRVLTILKTMVAQIDILETMTPLEFLSFRDRLESGSGFQSVQFRELEFVLGHKNLGALKHHEGDPSARQRLQKRFDEATLWDAFLSFLSQEGYELPASHTQRDVTLPIEPSREVQKTLVQIYRESATAMQVCERLVDFDEGLQEWRYRHVKMVQRTIGTRRGTGGSLGAEYLITTLFKPVFPDLWEIRTEL